MQLGKKSFHIIIGIVFLFSGHLLKASVTGSELWFTKNQLYPANKDLQISGVSFQGVDARLDVAKQELISGLNSLLGGTEIHTVPKQGDLVIALGKHANEKGWISKDELTKLYDDGFCIRQLSDFNFTLITGNTPKSILYAVFHYLRLLQTKDLTTELLDVLQVPAYQKRVLDHWDNLDGTIERGYAGKSIWKWDDLPQKVSYKYREYARANASIGINGAVLNNVNANPEILTSAYLHKVKVIADELRPYGIQVYLSANFAAPMVLAGLQNADPRNSDVTDWWQNKIAEIYDLIPDFGGFLVKANSEGQPGPLDYGLSHADGANMLADLLMPYNGIVMWRAFVYQPQSDDRANEAYQTFMPLDGKFRENVMLQVKNGPIDFQPREPFNPLFGAMQKTALMPELQITQEYLGFSTHLVYLGTLFQEFLQSDTYAHGKGSTIEKMTKTKEFQFGFTGMAGVANIGDTINWCGNVFAQANWYVFGRMAWNPEKSAEEIANEWVRQTFSQNDTVVHQIVKMMLDSREAAVNYMTPLGLHHLMGWGDHYGPEPWCEVNGARPDWLPKYYHRADSIGIGFDRTSTGSNAVAQYFEPLQSEFNDLETCPEKYLLWFHHIPWKYKMKNGNILWDELCYNYYEGVEQVRKMHTTWYNLKPQIDQDRFEEVRRNLEIQMKEATWWRDACVLYFQTFSKMPIPPILEPPAHTLNEIKKMTAEKHNL